MVLMYKMYSRSCTWSVIQLRPVRCGSLSMAATMSLGSGSYSGQACAWTTELINPLPSLWCTVYVCVLLKGRDQVARYWLTNVQPHTCFIFISFSFFRSIGRWLSMNAGCCCPRGGRWQQSNKIPRCAHLWLYMHKVDKSTVYVYVMRIKTIKLSMYFLESSSIRGIPLIKK